MVRALVDQPVVEVGRGRSRAVVEGDPEGVASDAPLLQAQKDISEGEKRHSGSCMDEAICTLWR